MNTLTSQTEYAELSARIETLLQKATKGGGFHSLTLDKGDELARFSLLAEAYEDRIPLMPTKVDAGHA